MRVFVTGATGLLGPNLIASLRAGGHEVSALVRSRERAAHALGDGVRLVDGDLRRVGGIETELAGIDCLIHAGACFREYAVGGCAPSVLTEVNVTGTERLLEAAYRQGVRNVVYVSSGGVLKAVAGAALDEGSPYDDGTRDPYFASKIAAERVAFAFAASHPALRLVAILPSAMAGPLDLGPTPTGRFLRKVVRGELTILLPGAISLVDARDVADAVVAAMEKGASGERFVVGGRTYPVAEVIATLARLCGRKPPTHRPPAPMLLLMARLMGIVCRLRGIEPPVRLTDLKRLLRRLEWDSSKAERILGVRFRPLEQTLADVAAWFAQPAPPIAHAPEALVLAGGGG